MTEEQESQNSLMADNNNSWLSSLSDELKNSESLKKFKDISSLANSYIGLEKSLNSRVAVPKNDASNEEWHKFYSRLGLPEDKRYTDKRVAEDEEYLSSYEEMFYRRNVL
ncbi:MAG: hypothetical protein ACIPMY_01160 [Rickettsia endosymbiont of Pentastiridius leporinus]